MPNRRRSSTQRAAPKLFRCTGYGNCDMVFTRSEHLARHERKHTGEKPYKCVVPGCGRMFSRFDNMMQHTQTHEKTKKSIDSSHVKKSSSTPIPTSTSHVVHGHHLLQHAPSLTPIKIESCWSEDSTNKQTIPDLVMATSMVNSRTLPLPTRRASFSSYSDQMVYPQAFQPSYSDTVPSSSYYYYQQQQQQEQGNNNIPRNRSSWPSKKPEESQFLPYNHHHHHYPTANNTNNNNYYYDSKLNHHSNNHDDDTYSETMYRRSSISTFSSDSNLTSPVTLHFPQQEPTIVKRRISIDDLRLPIEHLRNIQLEEEIEPNYNHHHEYYPTKKNDHNNSIDVTPAEYEALEGFSRFHSQSVIASHRDDSASASDSTPSPILRNNSPNMAAQVCAMRQRVMTQNESFSRR